MASSMNSSLFRYVRVLWTILALLMACSLSTCGGAPESDLITRLPGQPDVDFRQYSGYVTVDVDHGRALFYYFVEAEHDSQEKPLILWLNGGPGCSSVAGGAFTELGPFFPNGYADGLVKNQHSWNKVANLLFLESPAGVGWSYSNTTSDYLSATDDSTARDNMMFLLNWFEKFPEYKSREFFLTGESYAGHYIPQLAQLVLKYNENPTRGFSFNLIGVALGNPLIRLRVDAAAVYTYMWSHGMISDKTYKAITRTCDFTQFELTGGIPEECNEHMSAAYDEQGPFINDYDVFLDVCLPGVAEQELRLKKKITRRSLGVDVCIVLEMETYLNKPEVQKALHANTTNLNHSYKQCSSSDVLHYSLSNYTLDILPTIGELIRHDLRILVYSGDADQVVPFIGTRTNINDLAKSLKLKPTVDYTAWYHQKQVAGWTKSYGNLTFATVRAAAHMVPYSQPARALTLFTSFVTGKPLVKPVD
ncbi:serine carboxypeptidase-like clade II [Marchantia polymorpha subsp. ruderalis]|uniref:Carboxypeptidase n=2 Tax=Marchantia polymorpha TaxID=3197 RepID=A0AAF6AZF6_MARPO|nr:hypothetical protein MARPO_0037s0132 [Marchantia polymorpha]BBN05140.1 hypothetical protein Mp_3g10640 [Marchantia polymorpha subsp. ruderalis]|eukprot:PTQ40964.1 hypothetical protein MARPO_0037s0132 [Marchantia polymorpha]